MTKDPIKVTGAGGEIMAALGGVMQKIEAVGLEEELYHLVLLRASQINGCGYCVIMHTTDSRKVGVTDDRLDRLIAWRHMDVYSPRERAAFALTEALTILDPKQDYGSLRADLRQHFSEEEISVLTQTVAMINLWNRIQISNH